jgi:GNAT superfamily N-acetyltransferase
MHLERWRAASAAMAMAVATSAPVAALDRECAVETRLQWVDVSDLAPFAYRAMAAEAKEVLAEHGVCADLAQASTGSVRIDGEIGVILLPSMGGAGVGRHVMGATRNRAARRHATVWVYFNEVASALGLAGRPPETWTSIERATFGRALGRVAAHEVMHALLPQRPHDRLGLMAPSLGRRELTASALYAHPGLLADVRRAGRHARPKHSS